MRRPNHLCYAIALIAIASFFNSAIGQETKISTTNYPGTQIKKVEYEYIQGTAGTAGDLKYRDKKTGLIKERDLNTYSVNSMTPHGFWREYYQNGKLENEFHYDHGSREGAAKSFYENGSPKVNYNYKNNVIDGEFTEFHDNGKVLAKCVYNNGKRTGISTEYDPEGKPVAYLTYQEPEQTSNYVGAGEREVVARIIFLTKYPNGKTNEEGQLVSKYSQDRYPFSYYYDDFLRQGIFTTYDESGIKTDQKTYHNSMLEGLSITFYPNGNKKEETTYQPFKASDKMLTVVDGPYRGYYENGQLAKSGIIRSKVSKGSDGEYEAEQYSSGDWKRFNENGKMIEFMSYGTGEAIQCEMNEKAIEEQSEISERLPFDQYKTRMTDKFGKYFRFHYGSMMSDFKTKLNEANSYRFAHEIENKASPVFVAYQQELSTCRDADCVKQITNKLDNIFQKVYHIQNVNQIADKLQQPGQQIQDILEI